MRRACAALLEEHEEAVGETYQRCELAARGALNEC